MARHMKAASCRLLRSHAAVDGTPHRLMVPHRAPRPSAALPRQQEANFLPTVAFCAAISRNFKIAAQHCFCTHRQHRPPRNAEAGEGGSFPVVNHARAARERGETRGTGRRRRQLCDEGGATARCGPAACMHA